MANCLNHTIGEVRRWYRGSMEAQHHHSQDASEPLDLLIIGAGISGIDIAHHVAKEFPHWNWRVIDSNSDIGGTWNTFTYPGIRSDSDMATFALPFLEWPHTTTLGTAPQIREYLREAAAGSGMLDRLQLHSYVSHLDYNSAENLWHVRGTRALDPVNHAEGAGRAPADAAGSPAQPVATAPFSFTARRVHFAGGYFRHSAGYSAPIPGMDAFAGQVVHPQSWPEDLDVQGKRVVIIGSGATAVTLVPALHAMGAEVTMLQRTPTYIAPLPNRDLVSSVAKGVGGLVGKREQALAAARLVHVYRDMAQFYLCTKFPAVAKVFFWALGRRYLPAGVLRDHFRPPYNPWEQRVCKSPDGDFFQALQAGAAVVTGKIATMRADGVVLAAGAKDWSPEPKLVRDGAPSEPYLPADVIVLATGLELLTFGGAEIAVDGVVKPPQEMLAYRGLMLDGVPNFSYSIGYLNQSWTLRADMASRYLVRLWRTAAERGAIAWMPVRPAGLSADRPLLEMESGYIRRASERLPRQGDADPWMLVQDFVRERRTIGDADVTADMRFWS